MLVTAWIWRMSTKWILLLFWKNAIKVLEPKVIKKLWFLFFFKNRNIFQFLLGQDMEKFDGENWNLKDSSYVQIEKFHNQHYVKIIYLEKIIKNVWWATFFNFFVKLSGISLVIYELWIFSTVLILFFKLGY